jgi:CheY-like chemotaxis protein
VDVRYVLGRIRDNKHTGHLAVVIMTASREEQNRAESYELRANGNVIKPIDADQFVAAVQRISMFWLGLNHAPPQPPPSAQ